MATKLFVSGLPYRTTSEELAEFFSQPDEEGKVLKIATRADAEGNEQPLATVVFDKETGRSRGFGFVEMTSEEDAAEAIRRFHNAELGGRTIGVNEARPREERPRY